MATWLVRSTPDRVVLVTVTVPLSTQVCKWVPFYAGGNPAMD